MPDRITFPDISPRAYEHPTDRAALAALRQVRGFDLVLKQVLGHLQDRRVRLLFLANAVRVGPRQIPKLHGLLHEACEVLDIEPAPELYVAQSPAANAMAIGVQTPFIAVNSGLLNLLDEDELRCVLGHELGHVLSGHALYKTMLIVLTQLMRWVLPRALGAVALPVLLALLEWDRKSELTADRAGLLVAQVLAVSQSVDVKLAGGSGLGEVDLEEFERQAEEYEEEGGVIDSVFKLLNLVWMSHPFPVLRVVELGRWADSPEHLDILQGHYPRRGEDEAEPSLDSEILSAARSYRERLADSRDALSELGRDAVDLGERLLETLRSSGREDDERDRPSS